jgi:UDP:flavonoid glycosyltransferase YjiC (YdhE family)
VCIAVPPDLVGFVESAGLTAVAYKLESQAVFHAYITLWKHYYFSRNLRKTREVTKLRTELMEIGLQCISETSATLLSLADGADLILTGVNLEGPAANVAEYYDIPLATLHYSPVRANGQVLPMLPSPVVRSALRMREWLLWRLTKRLDDTQRGELGLSETKAPFARRMEERGTLEIQAYEEDCFPGLAAEWAKWGGRRPFVGTLSMGLSTNADEEVASWVAAGTPPIFFGFGSMLVESPADTLAMINAACAELGERALVCSAGSDFSGAPNFEHVKVVGTVNFASTFPSCRALVHHGGSSTTPMGMRAGVPTLILWTIRDQWMLGAAVKRLKVGTSRRFSTTTRESLVEDLRTVLAPEYVARARAIGTRMTMPRSTHGAAATADLVENLAGSRSVG